MDRTRCFHNLYTWCTVLVIGGFIFSCISMPALADAPVITGNVTLGGLTETAAATYSFTGAIGSTATFPMPFTVSDLTGSGAGWHITLSTSQFTNPNHPPFPLNAVSMTAMGDAVCVTAGTCSVDPIIFAGVTLPVALTSGALAVQGTPATIFRGPASGGSSGIYTVTPTISVAIPGNAFITGVVNASDVYTSTFTLTVVSGPTG